MSPPSRTISFNHPTNIEVFSSIVNDFQVLLYEYRSITQHPNYPQNEELQRRAEYLLKMFGHIVRQLNINPEAR